MKKNLLSSLKNSLEEEKKAIKSKSFLISENRFSKAEKIFDNEVDEGDSSTLNYSIEKVVRDTFTMPEDDYGLIEQCRQRLLILKQSYNKSEIIRAGLLLLNKLSDTDLLSTLLSIKKIKTGRKKYKK